LFPYDVHGLKNTGEEFLLLIDAMHIVGEPSQKSITQNENLARRHFDKAVSRDLAA